MRIEHSPFENAIRNIADINLYCDEPMASHTTFRIGGPADFYIEPRTVDALVHVMTVAQSYGIPVQAMGRGSNLLFDDAGFAGVVLSTAEMKDISVEGTHIVASAGASLTTVSKTAMEHSLAGLAFANGIPGSVGGAVYMNAGAYDGEIAQTLMESTYYDTVSGEVVTLAADAHAFSYRHSIYREHPAWIILSATFHLTEGNKDEIASHMEELMRRRIEKQPLEYPSAGSAFKRYPGRYTGQMIDEAGLKGFSVGGAQVSEKHAGFIINRGNATAKDVLALIQTIQDTIFSIHGIKIEPEVVYVPSNPTKL